MNSDALHVHRPDVENIFRDQYGAVVEAMVYAEQRCQAVERYVERLRAALSELADLHHRTLRNSQLHDSVDFRECLMRSCCNARDALADDASL